MFKPKTLSDAYGPTNLQEATLVVVKKKNKVAYSHVSSVNSRFKANVTTNDKPLLALPTTQPIGKVKRNTPQSLPNRKQLSQKGYEEKRANNLCIYCDQKCKPGPKCEEQLFTLMVLADNKKN